MKTLSHPTSLFTTASPSPLSWTPSRPSHAEATQPQDVSSLRTPWTRLRCHPSPTTPACQPWSTMRACCCVKKLTGLGAYTARPHCRLGAPRKSRPAWPGSTVEGNSEGQGGSWDAALRTAGSTIPGPKSRYSPGSRRGLALRREPPESTFYCRELVCCHVQRPQQHEGCGFSFYFISTFPFLWVFLSFFVQ